MVTRFVEAEKTTMGGGGGGGGQFASGPIRKVGGGGGGRAVHFRSMGGDHCQNSHPLFNYQGGGVSEVVGGVVKWGGGGVMQCYRLWQGKSKFHSIPIPISCHTVGNQSFSIVGV